MQTGEGVNDVRKGACANHVSTVANFLKVWSSFFPCVLPGSVGSGLGRGRRREPAPLPGSRRSLGPARGASVCRQDRGQERLRSAAPALDAPARAVGQPSPAFRRLIRDGKPLAVENSSGGCGGGKPSLFLPAERSLSQRCVIVEWPVPSLSHLSPFPSRGSSGRAEGTWRSRVVG